jgi:glutathione synthase/RimK-type ligase-like ATP-grasp enzyme
VYARNAIKIPDETRDRLYSLATLTIGALGLDFGAVDILRTPDEVFKVIEVNTAPGVEGTTLQRYVDAFKKVIGE